MGTAKKKSQKELITVETSELRERLNKLFQSRHGQGLCAGHGEGLFECLWDLKEKALLEHRASVEVPGDWLSQLEQEQDQVRH
ncbi:MAG: hypothetical protein JSS83_00320 [Cyanobacteria bacterium SZAS LIN-3]|nr:hypothetical protein [Cyanobacteria bacterium SZAS LIN-3]